MSDPVVVIGAGQAGLAVSHALTALGIDHVILERDRVGSTWRRRWRSFCLVTPNWTLSLPGQPYSGPQPDGFVLRDEIASTMERFAASFAAPIHAGVQVTALRSIGGGGFHLTTSSGDIRARQVVVATGAYQRPFRPGVAAELPSGLLALDADDYTEPGALPNGPVLVVGSGQTGIQVAEDLHLAGRQVFLSCGRAAWAPRRMEGRDVVTWLAQTDWFDHPLNSLPSPEARLAANLQLTGRDGGHDLHYRVLNSMGVHLLGRLASISGTRATFAPDLAQSIAFGDSRYVAIRKLLREQLAAKGLRAPEMPDPTPFEYEARAEISLDGFAAVIFTSGFRPDYTSWVDVPAFDALGFPVAPDGSSQDFPGLHFVGVHFLRNRRSSLIWGVGDDATLVAGAVAAQA